jgi:hypothetical protein
VASRTDPAGTGAEDVKQFRSEIVTLFRMDKGTEPRPLGSDGISKPLPHGRGSVPLSIRDGVCGKLSILYQRFNNYSLGADFLRNRFKKIAATAKAQPMQIRTKPANLLSITPTLFFGNNTNPVKSRSNDSSD